MAALLRPASFDPADAVDQHDRHEHRDRDGFGGATARPHDPAACRRNGTGPRCDRSPRRRRHLSAVAAVPRSSDVGGLLAPEPARRRGASLPGPSPRGVPAPVVVTTRPRAGAPRAVRAARAGVVAVRSRRSPAVYRRRRLGVLLVMITATVLVLQLVASVTADEEPVLVTDAAAAGVTVDRPVGGTPRIPSVGDDGPSGAVYVVQPGDTLWSIAGAIAPGVDRRPVVDELAERLGGASLVPGQRIELDGLGAP